jgi:hypothetical protein
MATRIVQTYQAGNFTAKLCRCSDFQEWSVKFYADGQWLEEADYFAGSDSAAKSDAIQTAKMYCGKGWQMVYPVLTLKA